MLTNLEFEEMTLNDWLCALPVEHKARRQVHDIMLTIQVARDYLVDNGWDCSLDGSPYCLLCNLDAILEEYENTL